jgi:hypothetical protein
LVSWQTLLTYHKRIKKGIFSAFKIALVASTVYNFWVIDSSVTNHITNNMTSLYNFEKLSTPTRVSIAIGKHISVKSKGKIKLISSKIESLVLYIFSFPFQLLFIGKISRTLNYRVIFNSYRVLFQDLATKKTISEGFIFQELYYFSSNSENNKYHQVFTLSSLCQDQLLWHQFLAHP